MQIDTAIRQIDIAYYALMKQGHEVDAIYKKKLERKKNRKMEKTKGKEDDTHRILVKRGEVLAVILYCRFNL
jgi:truncated hemoglobin YjbI